MRIKLSRLLHECRTAQEEAVFATVGSPEEVRDEIAYLMSVFQ